MTPALRLDLPRVAYPRAPAALEHVRLEVAPGECVALLGGNGAGKTALLRTCAGLLPAALGAVRVSGTAVGGSATAAVAAGAALLFQDPDDQLFGLDVLDDVLTGPRNLGLPEAEAQRRAAAALAAVEATALVARPIDALSFGEKKRVGLAGVLAMHPSLLLLDEPTAGLDPLGELALVALLGELRRDAAVAMVVATHAVDLVPGLADRIVLLGEGRVLADGPSAEVFADHALLRRARVRAPRPLAGPAAAAVAARAAPGPQEVR